MVCFVVCKNMTSENCEKCIVCSEIVRKCHKDTSCKTCRITEVISFDCYQKFCIFSITPEFEVAFGTFSTQIKSNSKWLCEFELFRKIALSFLSEPLFLVQYLLDVLTNVFSKYNNFE